MTNEIRFEKYRHAYMHLLDTHGVDMIEANYYGLSYDVRAVIKSFYQATDPRRTLNGFISKLRSLAIDNEWRAKIDNVISSSFDFSEYKAWPIYHKSTVNVYLGLTQDIKIGSAIISVKNRTVQVSARISAEVMAEHKDHLKRTEMGVGFYEAAGPAIQIIDIYFN